MRIRINHISKTEGHSGFEGTLFDGDIAQARIEVQESARLIEGILVGRSYSDAPVITARICGICPVIHNLTAIKALETALGVKVNRETEILRKMMLYAQIIHSHTLHLFFMSLPDLVGVSEFKMIKKCPRESQAALDIRKFATELVRIIGGRAVHPINSEVGGFKREVNWQKIKEVTGDYDNILEAAVKLAQFFARFKYPKFERETEFVSLTARDEYAIYDGDILTSEGNTFKPEAFAKHIEEVEIGTVKRGKYQGASYMVGALARVNNNHAQLNKEAKKILQGTKLKLPIYNTFYNVLAQAIEVVHFVEGVNRLIIDNTRMGMPVRSAKSTAFAGGRIFANDYANKGVSRELEVKAGKGLAACEAPRGTLFHYYELDGQGKIKVCNIITPTAQFLNNLEDDLEAYIPGLKKQGNKRRIEKIKQLVRAYDPCFTCAVH